jgi:hypothetical protein
LSKQLPTDDGQPFDRRFLAISTGRQFGFEKYQKDFDLISY